MVQDHPPNVETMDCVMQEICCVDFSGFTKLGPSDGLKVNLSKTTNWKRQTEQPRGKRHATQPGSKSELAILAKTFWPNGHEINYARAREEPEVFTEASTSLSIAVSLMLFCRYLVRSDRKVSVPIRRGPGGSGVDAGTDRGPIVPTYSDCTKYRRSHDGELDVDHILCSWHSIGTATIGQSLMGWRVW